MSSQNLLHPALPPLPSRIKKLPVDARGFPVPWFVEWFHADGTSFEPPWPDQPVKPGDYPDFRVMDGRKLTLAYKRKLCWVCGDQLGRYLAFVIGPMCAINRISGELPSHRECAEFAAHACPFLVKPQVVRRTNDIPEGTRDAAGVGLKRNPGIALVWITKSFEAFQTDHIENTGGVTSQAGVLFRLGEPEELLWFREGRTATREEILASIESGLPLLKQAAMLDGPEAVKAMEESYHQALHLLPAA